MAVRRSLIRRTGVLSLSVVISVLSSDSARAWLRPSYEDAIVVERSELIVVARLKGGTIRYVPHKRKPHEGGSREHHAVLAITDVVKGKCDEKEIPIVIHYGLTPVVGGYLKRDGFTINRRALGDDHSKDIIEIFDTGNSAKGLLPLVEDAREDNLWFLRKRSGTYGRKPGTGKYGIVDPEDLQPLELKDYFLTYMTANPEGAVTEYARKNPDKAGRAKRYLDHLEVQRILKYRYPAERYEKLLPFFLAHTTWNSKCEARDGIVSCGKIAGDRLREVFDDPNYGRFRATVILMWRDMGYTQVVPFLIDLLRKHDRYWAKQKLEKGWWNHDVSSERTRRRRAIYGEVYCSVCALRTFGDPTAREALQMVRDRWKAIDFDNPQIVEECEAALREISQREAAASPLGQSAGRSPDPSEF